MRLDIATAGWMILCLGSVVGAADDPIHLRYRFEPGQVVRYSVSMRDDYQIQVGPASDEPYTEQESVKQYRVLSVNEDGSARLELLLESARLTVVNDGQKQEFNSETNNNENPAFAPLQNMLGKPHLQVTASPTGALSDIKLLLDGSEKPNDISQSALDAFVGLPEEPIAVGTSWREDLDVPVKVSETLFKTVKVQRRYHLLKVENDRATIQFETKILSPVNDPDEEIQLIRRPTRGTLLLDLKRGIMVSKLVTLDNTVTNFGGGPSVMTLKQRHVERLLETRTAAADTASGE